MTDKVRQSTDAHQESGAATKPFGVEYLEEIPSATMGFGSGSPSTDLCTGLQTGGGDDPLAESECEPPA